MNELLIRIAEIFCLSILVGIVFHLVRREHLRDKYGLLWSLVLVGMFCKVFYAVSKMDSWDVSPEVLYREFSIMAVFLAVFLLGVVLTAALTRYSKERRRSVQEMALLRFDVNEMMQLSEKREAMTPQGAEYKTS